jgi:hypothetical protein
MAIHLKFTAAQVIDAIRASRGLVTVAARRLECHPDTIRHYVNRYVTVKSALTVARDTMTDMAEAQLFNHITAGDMGAITFYLRTQGRDRGYVERREITGAEGGPVRVLSEDPADMREDLIARLNVIAGRLSPEPEALPDPEEDIVEGTVVSP